MTNNEHYNSFINENKYLIIKKYIKFQTRIMTIMSGISLLTLMLIVVADVVGRYFNRPIGAAYELSMILMGLVVLLGIAYTTSLNRHTRVELLTAHFNKRLQAISGIVSTIIVIILWVLIAWQNVVAGITYFNRGQVTEQLGVPLFPLYFLVAAGAIAVFFELVLYIIAQFAILRGSK